MSDVEVEFMGHQFGPDVKGRNVCFLTLRDCGRIALASAHHYRLAGLFCLLHEVHNDRGTESTALADLKLRKFAADDNEAKVPA